MVSARWVIDAAKGRAGAPCISDRALDALACRQSVLAAGLKRLGARRAFRAPKQKHIFRL
eukprot:9518526-Lingulodinium_polyedra.AAC.1